MMVLLLSIIELEGVTNLIGAIEFEKLVKGLTNAFDGAMTRPGHAFQIYFNYDKQNVKKGIEKIYAPALETAQRLGLELNDLFTERSEFMSKYCAQEKVYFVLFTRPFNLPKDQLKASSKNKLKMIKEKKAPAFKYSQAIYAAIPEIRDTHEAYVRSILNDMESLFMLGKVLEVHDGIKAIRMSSDPNFTGEDWRASLPGDMVGIREINNFEGDASDLLWPPLSKQILPRDAEIIDRRTVLVGNTLYASIYIDLFSKDIRPFMSLFSRILPTQIPWRISF